MIQRQLHDFIVFHFHEVQLYLMQTRIHADERGNKASLITASGTVVNLPAGNYAQNVPTTYSPHIIHHYPKGQETRIEEVPTDQPALPAPVVPTFAQLLSSGETRPHEVQSILGYTDGNPRPGDWDKLHSFFVVGLSGNGKSSTVAHEMRNEIVASRLCNAKQLHEPSC